MVPIEGLGGLKPAGGPEKPGYAQSRPSSASGASSGSKSEDKAEISNQGLALIALHDIPPTREGLVKALKAAINSGKYDVEAALKSGLPGLAEDLSRA